MIAVRFGRRTFPSIAQALVRVTAARAALMDRSEPLEKIKSRQIKRWAENFDGEGNIYDEWPAIAGRRVNNEGEESLGWTGSDRVAMGLDPDSPILIRTGGTLNSFVTQNEAGEVGATAVDWTFRNTGGGVRGGAYPVSHHTGYTTALNTVIPARVLWDLDDEDEEAAKDQLERYVDQVIKRYF